MSLIALRMTRRSPSRYLAQAHYAESRRPAQTPLPPPLHPKVGPKCRTVRQLFLQKPSTLGPQVETSTNNRGSTCDDESGPSSNFRITTKLITLD